MRARIEEVNDESTAEVLVIRDVGNGVALTVTNDAERVVAFLHGNGILRGRKLLYYDTEGALDELVYNDNGIFTGFAPGPGRA